MDAGYRQEAAGSNQQPAGSNQHPAASSKQPAASSQQPDPGSRESGQIWPQTIFKATEIQAQTLGAENLTRSGHKLYSKQQRSRPRPWEQRIWPDLVTNRIQSQGDPGPDPESTESGFWNLLANPLQNGRFWYLSGPILPDPRPSHSGRVLEAPKEDGFERPTCSKNKGFRV